MRYPIPGIGGFNYVPLDISSRRRYVSHATHMGVLDVDNGKVVGGFWRKNYLAIQDIAEKLPSKPL
jgi:hypothetical protein